MIITKIDKEQAWEIRHQVMWPEKPFEYIKLEDDDVGIHYGLFKENKLISVISFFYHNREGQFRKFATVQEEQGKGYGGALLNYMLKEAATLGVKKIRCNARNNKVSFYQKFGMHETKEQFSKGGKQYVIMEKDL